LEVLKDLDTLRFDKDFVLEFCADLVAEFLTDLEAELLLLFWTDGVGIFLGGGL